MYYYLFLDSSGIFQECDMILNLDFTRVFQESFKNDNINLSISKSDLLLLRTFS
jgi:hypothetical protein